MQGLAHSGATPERRLDAGELEVVQQLAERERADVLAVEREMLAKPGFIVGAQAVDLADALAAVLADDCEQHRRGDSDGAGAGQRATT